VLVGGCWKKAGLATNNATNSRGCSVSSASSFTPQGRDTAEWLDFSRGLVMEPVEPASPAANEVMGPCQAFWGAAQFRLR